jgi:SSS family solute:Na+ symporter
MSLIIVIVLVFYLLVTLGVGYSTSKKIESNEDFAVSGRRLSPLLLAFSLAATEIGVGSSLGVFEKSLGDLGGFLLLGMF